MANSIFHDDAYGWLNLYWASFVGLLSVLTVKYWRRGNSTKSEKMSNTSKSVAFVFLLLFLISGSYNYYQYNVMNVSNTREERIAYKTYYEYYFETS